MRTRRQATISDLRQAVECLPRGTRIAMLEGMRSNEIIVGAYTDGGGICPMLAAHRAGGRTSLISFARAWDRFAFRGSRVRVARQATEHELLVLRTHLEASLLEEDVPAAELGAAIAEHRELMARRAQSREPWRRERRRRERPGDADRSSELRTRPGWAWLRPFRRYDEYERALDWLAAEEEALREREERRLPALAGVE
jgi:hypothetical protein